MKYGIISDTHYHQWTAFANKTGLVNSRLEILLKETRKMADFMAENDIHTLFHLGDCFHDRKSVTPIVMNSVINLYGEIVGGYGIEVNMLAGNHDLETNDSHELSASSSALQSVGVNVITDVYEYEDIVMVPWHSSVDELKKKLESLDSKGKTLMIHAPVNDVIMGIPNNGLDGEYLRKLGFDKVFSGHYHKFKEVAHNVFSVGSLTHQTWSDVGTKSGYIMVDNGTVAHYESKAPKFVDYDESLDDEALEKAVKGNYVRAKLPLMDSDLIKEFKEKLNEFGALGVIVNTYKDTGSKRHTGVRTDGVSVDSSISDYVKAEKMENDAKVIEICQQIMKEVERV